MILSLEQRLFERCIKFFWPLRYLMGNDGCGLGLMSCIAASKVTCSTGTLGSTGVSRSSSPMEGGCPHLPHTGHWLTSHQANRGCGSTREGTVSPPESPCHCLSNQLLSPHTLCSFWPEGMTIKTTPTNQVASLNPHEP